MHVLLLTLAVTLFLSPCLGMERPKGKLRISVEIRNKLYSDAPSPHLHDQGLKRGRVSPKTWNKSACDPPSCQSIHFDDNCIYYKVYEVYTLTTVYTTKIDQRGFVTNKTMKLSFML